MSKKVVIIGGGIIGLCSAYYLQKEGHQVTVVDKSNMGDGASYVNAGYLSPSHIVPLSAPGVMKKGLKWMMNPTSPLYIKPRLDLDFLKWSWAFHKSCTDKHVQKSIPIIKDISLLSQELYSDIKGEENFNFKIEKKGLLMLCQTSKMLATEVATAELAKKEGLKVKELNFDELKKVEPNIQINVKGATYYECDAHLTPQEFMDEMKNHLLNSGVQFLKNEEVLDLEISNQKITAVKTSIQILKADEFVLTAGSWTSLITKKIGLNLLLQAGKGYCINSNQKTNISVPAILAEAKVAVTPMNGFTRFAGTMEIAGINKRINKLRVDAISKAVSNYYPKVNLTEEEKEEASSGLRPLSYDGLPYIGKSNKCKNLTIATGHAMMGLTMGTATGKLVSEIISEQKLSLDLKPFNPDRTYS